MQFTFLFEQVFITKPTILSQPRFCFNSGQVVWQKMIEEPTDEFSLKGLADAIKLLYDASTKEWTADDVISLVDELSGKKIYLLTQNNRSLLLKCSYKIVTNDVSIGNTECSKIFKEFGIMFEKNAYNELTFLCLPIV